MSPRVLLIGGHGKVSMLMTPKLLDASFKVTSMIRDLAQKDEITVLGKGKDGQLDILVSSLEDIKTPQQATAILNQVKPDYVVWSAGAGGKGGPSRTFAIDRDAAQHFIRASVAKDSGVKKFMMISYLGSRRNKPHWWTDEDWAASQRINEGALRNYFAAKVEADECLTGLAQQRGEGFKAICLRPGTLTDDEGRGKVSLGHTRARGKVARVDVASVAVNLLTRDDAEGWVDLLEGEEPIWAAVERVVKERVDGVDGEDVQAMTEKFQLS
jgi:nucleoside-diphosphate-sugar epimerase